MRPTAIRDVGGSVPVMIRVCGLRSLSLQAPQRYVKHWPFGRFLAVLGHHVMYFRVPGQAFATSLMAPARRLCRRRLKREMPTPGLDDGLLGRRKMFRTVKFGKLLHLKGASASGLGNIRDWGLLGLMRFASLKPTCRKQQVTITLK